MAMHANSTIVSGRPLLRGGDPNGRLLSTGELLAFLGGREHVERTIETLIEALDAADSDPDREDDETEAVDEDGGDINDQPQAESDDEEDHRDRRVAAEPRRLLSDRSRRERPRAAADRERQHLAAMVDRRARDAQRWPGARP